MKPFGHAKQPDYMVVVTHEKQFEYVRLRELTGGALPALVMCDGCDFETPGDGAYVLVDPDGDERVVHCLTCALHPCEPDCHCECCQTGGIIRYAPVEDAVDQFEVRSVPCVRCNGHGWIVTEVNGREHTCWSCFGEGEREVYLPRVSKEANGVGQGTL
jgi:hypothetical protein